MESNLSFVRYKGDGHTTQFAIIAAGENMGYFRIEDIHAFVNGKEVPITIHPATPYIVLMTTAPAIGDDIIIRRVMPTKKPYSDFSRGNNFGHRQVNNSFLQQLYLTQEILDGFFGSDFYLKHDLNMGGHRIVNMGDPVDDNDAVTNHIVKSLDEKHTGWNKEQDTRLDALESIVPTSDVNFLVPYVFIAEGGEMSIKTSYSFNYCELHINGVKQVLSRSFNFAGGDIFFAESLLKGDVVEATLGTFENIQIGTTFLNHIVDITVPTYRVSVPEISFNTVFLNGVLQIPNRAYALVAKELVFAEELLPNDVVHIMYAPK